MAHINPPTIFVSLILALCAYEIYALADQRPGDTISEIIWALSARPLVPFAAGFLCGHFFFPKY